MRHTMGNRAAIIAITFMWLVTIPGVLLFFTRVIGWPWDLTLLISAPFFLFFVPAGYPLAMAAGERSRRGLGFGIPLRALIRFSVSSLPIALVSLSAVWVYGQINAGAYLGAIIAALIGVLCAWAGVRAFARLISDIKGSGENPPIASDESNWRSSSGQ
ncbi:MAG: hypothetical protein GXP48_05905 [Acidobacteria bacterium]|nr:hypothetical protein [Acidobacteriota bacterium]